MTRVGGWGRFPVVDAEILVARSTADVGAALAGGSLISRGLGRSYGDSSLGARMLDLTALDAFVDFDETTGALTVEAGVSLSAILSAMVPRGWFLPVTPGTRFVTVGGAIAADIHGKNHHKDGSFSDHVSTFKLVVASGETLIVSRESHPELFRATCGGMGLTGVIVEATVALRAITSSNIDETLIKAPTLDSALDAFDEYGDATYSVAWIDLLASGASLGRSLVMIGEHAVDGPLRVSPDSTLATIPFAMPSALLNKVSVAAFNALYYERVRQPVSKHSVPFEPYFYPLDKAAEWNRLYGKQGLIQYQFVIPFGDGPSLLRAIIERISAAGLASPLAVLKLFGVGNDNHLSFPMPGYTLALDFKATASALKLATELDELVIAASGRHYLAKDSRMTARTFQAGYERIPEFEAVRRQYGAAGVFVSAQSQRLELS